MTCICGNTSGSVINTHQLGKQFSALVYNDGVCVCVCVSWGWVGVIMRLSDNKQRSCFTIESNIVKQASGCC